MGADPTLPPFATEETAEFWRGCARGELLLQRCDDCGAWQFYPRPFCTACTRGSVRWATASGRGTLASWSIVRRPVDPSWAAEAPYVLALVALDEGPRLMTALTGCEPSGLAIGMRVAVAFDVRPNGAVLPRFRPAG